MPRDLDLVRLGEHDMRTEIDCEKVDGVDFCADIYQDYLIEDSFIHPGYNVSSKDSFHDVLLIKLNQSVEFSKFIQPICLPLEASLIQENFAGHSFTVSGWGKLYSTERQQMHEHLKIRRPNRYGKFIRVGCKSGEAESSFDEF